MYIAPYVLVNYPTEALSLSYCFESCASGISDAVNPQRSLNQDKFQCMEEKGGLYTDKANGNGMSMEPNLGTTQTNKTIAIVLKHDQTRGSRVPKEIKQHQTFYLNRCHSRNFVTWAIS